MVWELYGWLCAHLKSHNRELNMAHKQSLRQTEANSSKYMIPVYKAPRIVDWKGILDEVYPHRYLYFKSQEYPAVKYNFAKCARKQI